MARLVETSMCALCAEWQRGSAKHVPRYAPVLHFKCAHSQPLHLMGTNWAKAHMGHVNPISGKMADTNINHWWVFRYGVRVVKTRVQAAANSANAPQLAPLKLYNATKKARLPKEPRLEKCQLGRTYAGSMQKTGNFRPQLTLSGRVGMNFLASPQADKKLCGCFGDISIQICTSEFERAAVNNTPPEQLCRNVLLITTNAAVHQQHERTRHETHHTPVSSARPLARPGSLRSPDFAAMKAFQICDSFNKLGAKLRDKISVSKRVRDKTRGE
eukprot:1160641-Pelagomonas_calceolata.AAC.1